MGTPFLKEAPALHAVDAIDQKSDKLSACTHAAVTGAFSESQGAVFLEAREEGLSSWGST
eukprot:1160714-Pelagomonas_calceolata.AAC.28